MEKVPAQDANRRFTALLKKVDEEGAVSITKYGKEMYVIMRYELYNRNEFEKPFMEKAAEGLWLDCTDQSRETMSAMGFADEGRTLCRVKTFADQIQFLKMHFGKDEDYPESCTKIQVPVDTVSFKDEEPLAIWTENVTDLKICGYHIMKDIEPVDEDEREVKHEVDEAVAEYNERTPELVKACFKGSRFMVM